MRKCLVIAAGRGSRLAGGGLPKPLFRLQGLPLIERTIVNAKRAGLEEFTVVTGYDNARVTKFLDRLALRRGIAITHLVNEKWDGGNGLSVLAAREVIGDDPFVLLMADHVVAVPLLSGLLNESVEDGGVCLAIDRDLSNPLVDLDDVTKVRASDVQLEAIGKDLERYNAFDTGCFLCSSDLFSALDQARRREGDESLSAGIALLAEQGKMRVHDVGEAFWIDVDDASAVARAERALIAGLPKLGDGPISRHLNRPLSIRITRHLIDRSITPNQISFFSFTLCLVAAGLFAAGGALALAVGGLLAQAASVVDGCDGEVARLRLEESDFGGWFDAVLDRYADACLLFGLTWHVFFAAGVYPLALFVGFLAITGSFLVSYTADKYDGLMKTRFERGATLGFRIGRDLRVLVIALGAVLNLPLLALSLIAVVMNAETVRRIVTAGRERAEA
ncbi:MAG: NTP transferase domain-containing protein [Myxococcota bacterium]